MTQQDRFRLKAELFDVEGKIIGLKANCRRRYGRHKSAWPESKRALWDDLTARARSIHEQLKEPPDAKKA